MLCSNRTRMCQLKLLWRVAWRHSLTQAKLRVSSISTISHITTLNYRSYIPPWKCKRWSIGICPLWLPHDNLWFPNPSYEEQTIWRVEVKWISRNLLNITWVTGSWTRSDRFTDKIKISVCIIEKPREVGLRWDALVSFLLHQSDITMQKLNNKHYQPRADLICDCFAKRLLNCQVQNKMKLGNHWRVRLPACKTNMNCIGSHIIISIVLSSKMPKR